MAEYIKREDVIEKLTGLFQLQAETAKAIVESIPTADVRPVARGKWITVMYHLYECSECGAAYQDVGYGFNFCPNCGARMGGEEDV